ncbi:MAG: hypothetical protein A2284_03260 [Deltaproteobacteria bacterium RIFOXYA12_FULL_61_11]|nr:MAG: hypothetical protein A2284_03260 [Deltaproteobacteria bacterium RIFOXYA12_FULL_61_11]
MNRSKQVLLVVLLCGLLLFAGLCSTLVQFERDAVSVRHQTLFVVPRATVAKALALGHHGLLADASWIKVVLYAADIMLENQDVRWMQPLLELVTELDPTWANIYIWGGASFIYNGKLITEEMVRLSNWILEKGAARVPDNWEIPFMLAINYYLELRDFERAADWMVRAAEIPGAPVRYKTLAARWLKEVGRRDAAVGLLTTELIRAQADSMSDKQVEAKLLQRLVQYNENNPDLLERSRALGERYRTEFPYLPFGLWLQVVELEAEDDDSDDLEERFPLLGLPSDA